MCVDGLNNCLGGSPKLPPGREAATGKPQPGTFTSHLLCVTLGLLAGSLRMCTLGGLKNVTGPCHLTGRPGWRPCLLLLPVPLDPVVVVGIGGVTQQMEDLPKCLDPVPTWGWLLHWLAQCWEQTSGCSIALSNLSQTLQNQQISIKQGQGVWMWNPRVPTAFPPTSPLLFRKGEGCLAGTCSGF